MPTEPHLRLEAAKSATGKLNVVVVVVVVVVAVVVVVVVVAEGVKKLNKT